MSSALYAVRLIWRGWSGHFAWHAVHVDLVESPPILTAMGLAEMEFSPGVQVAICREVTSGMRDMTPAEIARVRAWLEKRAAAVRSAINDPTEGQNE